MGSGITSFLQYTNKTKNLQIIYFNKLMNINIQKYIFT